MTLPRLRTSALQSMAGAMLQKSIPFAASIYVARTVSHEDFASFAFTLSTANTITAVSAMGLAPAVLTTLAGSNSTQEIEKKTYAIYIISCFICIIASMIGLLVSNLELGAIQHTGTLLSAAILSPALILLQTTQSALQGTHRHGRFLTQSCALAAAVTLSLMFADIFNATAVVLTLSYAVAFMAVGSLSASHELRLLQTPFRDAMTKAKAELKPIIFSQLPFAGYTAVWMLAIYLCNFRIASTFSTEDLAYYNVGFQWYSMMLLIPATLGGVLIPRFIVRNDLQADPSRKTKLTILFLTVAVILSLALIAASPKMLELYGMTAQDEGLNTVRLLVMAGGIAFTLTPTLQELMAFRRFAHLMAISLSWAAVALPGTYFYAKSSAHVALFFLLGYCAVAAIILIYHLVSPNISQEK